MIQDEFRRRLLNQQTRRQWIRCGEATADLIDSIITDNRTRPSLRECQMNARALQYFINKKWFADVIHGASPQASQSIMLVGQS